MQQDLPCRQQADPLFQGLRLALANGKKLTTFLRTGLREHYGKQDKLREFGIPPFRRRSKKDPVVKPPEGGEPPKPGV